MNFSKFPILSYTPATVRYGLILRAPEADQILYKVELLSLYILCHNKSIKATPKPPAELNQFSR